MHNYQSISVEPYGPHLGAEISNIDITKPLSDIQCAELKQALQDHLVIFFRDQHLDFESHQNFGRIFGELITHSGGVGGVEGYPYVVQIHADENSEGVAGEAWHSDLSCNEEPPLGSILYLHTVPRMGGDTLFSSMYAAYDALSDKMKAYLDGLYAVHDGEHVYRKYTKDPSKRFPCSVHPIVRRNPVTGRKALFADAQYTTEIVGVPRTESKGILAFLAEHCQNPEFQVRFRWQPHSVAFWDNRYAEHHAVWDYFPHVRSGYRVTIKGEKPTA